MCNTVNFSPKAMSSYHHLLQQTKPRFESPAKVFAKLKAKVQREAMCARDPYCNVREKHGADFNSPRKRTESTWMNEEPTENHRFGSYRSEVQALTLSPISTPQKTLGYSLDISSKPAEEMPPLSEMGHAFLSRYRHTPTTRAFLESTAVSHPLCQVNREEIRTKPPQIRDDGFKVTSRTPVKIQPVENDCVRAVFEEDYAPLGKPMSPAKMFSPMRKRLRKRKWEQQEFNKVSSSTKEVNSEVVSQPKERKTSTAFSEDNGHNKTCIEDLGHIIGLPADQSEMNPLNHDPVFPPPRSATEKRCYVVMEKCPPMSPAKMFAFMKERESKRGQQEVHEVSSSTRELFGNNFRQSRDTPLSTPHGVTELEDLAFRSVSESVVPVDQSIVESADSQSDPSEDVAIPAARSQPVLLEDPLVLNSPRISIPKKHQAVFKHNKWPQLTKFPNESVIYLKQWFLRKNHKGLFVDGIHRENNIPWNSNIIADRVSNSVLKTVSGRVYILVGRMNLDVDSGFPKWLLKKFANGFPPNWKTLYEKFLSESRPSSRKTEKTSEGRAIVAKTKSDPSSISLSVKPQRQKPFKTPDSCPPSISASTKVSRSGRVIKPPLEYWKGGRVILDAHMNVTIHECYDTSICIPEVTTMVSARKSQKPARVFLPCSEGHKQCESATNEEAPGPQRKVKAPLRKHSRAKGNHDEKPPNPPEPLVEAISSPEECSGRTTRSSKRSPAMEKISYVDTVSQKTVSEKTSTWKSKKQGHDPTRPSERGRKQTVTASPESPTVNDKTLQQQSSDEEFSIKRKKQKKGVYRKKGRKVLNKSQSSHMSPSTQSSESFEESGKEPRERTRLTKKSDATQTLTKHKPSKGTKISPPTKTLPKSTQPHKANKGSTTIPQEQDEDKWTEAELIKLKEAVSYYPKHVAGYWAKVARMVGTRSAEECHNQHTSHGVSQTPAKRAKKPRKEKVEAPKDPDRPVISARVGTLKRKQQVRQFLEAMPREDADDVFSSAYMQNKRFEIPSMCPSEDHDLTVSDLEPLTPMSKVFPEVKTPQCLHITPGMMGSPNRSNDDKYVYQLQKRMKKNQFNVCKQAHSAKSFTPTPSVKRTMRRCGNTENDTFVVWEMFPGNDVALSESGEEEDFYFSDND
ncbi:mis18-binding protein 1 isoform X2 [Toxotes jaculatrix]|uniref:mis18-binding protein 1 isoform X2 n=1 Tax=Toxotes jaculatrix TaxID=941984 RepID=UPI001B3A9E84|nr:mis18-binding protein 1 isoform X2 [Toxotes jaculatrix]